MFAEAHCIFHYPLETWVLNHVQAHGQCKGATYRLISHCRVTMLRKSRVCCGWNVSGRASNYGSWSALEHRDPRRLFRGVATHRLQVTMVVWRWEGG